MGTYHDTDQDSVDFMTIKKLFDSLKAQLGADIMGGKYVIIYLCCSVLCVKIH